MKSINHAYILIGVFIIFLSAGRGVTAHGEYIRIEFNAHRPSQQDCFDDVIDKTQEKYLQEISDELKGNPTIGIKVVGYTDKNECSGIECSKLSLRRSRMIYEWLVKSGVPAFQLKGPDAGGSDWPLEKDAVDEKQRRSNRRVQFAGYPIEKK